MADTLIFEDDFSTGTTPDTAKWAPYLTHDYFGWNITSGYLRYDSTNNTFHTALREKGDARLFSDVTVDAGKNIASAQQAIGINVVGDPTVTNNTSTSVAPEISGTGIFLAWKGYQKTLIVNGTQVSTDVLPGGGTSTTPNQRIRMRYESGTLYLKQWAVGDAEPAEWGATVDLSSYTIPAGNLMLMAGAISTANPIITFDNVSVMEVASNTPVTVDLDTPTASLQSIEPEFVGFVLSDTIDLTTAALSVDADNSAEYLASADVSVEAATVALAAVEADATVITTIDLDTAVVSATANEPVVESQVIKTEILTPTSDFLVNSAGTITQQTTTTIEVPVGNNHGVFLFDLPADYFVEGLIKAELLLGTALRWSGNQYTTTFGFAPITAVDTGNYYNSTVGTEVVVPQSSMAATIDITSAIGTDDLKGVRVRVTNGTGTHRITLGTSEDPTPTARFRLALTYAELPNVTVDVPTATVTAQAVEATIEVVDPISDTVDVSTAGLSLNISDASFEELRTAVLVPTVDGYRTQGGTSWNNGGEVLSLNYSPTTNLTSVLLPQGSATEVATINRALERFDFPLETLQAGIQAKYGRNYVTVSFRELGDGESGGTVLGQFVPSSGVIELDISLVNSVVVARSTLIHEVAHLVDHVLLTNSQRVSIWNALHPYPSEKLAAGTQVVSGVALNHGHYWNGGGDYFDRVGEAFANTFIRAYSDVFFLDTFTHSATVAAAESIRNVITPTLPAQLGPFPSRTPAIRLDFAPVPAGVLTGSVKSAVLTLNVTWNTGGQYTLQTINPTGRLQEQSAEKTVTLTTGQNNIDVSDIFDPHSFDIIHIGNVKGSNSQSLNVTSTEDALAAAKPRLTVTYSVSQGATVVDVDTATASMTMPEPEVDATTSPDAIVDVESPAIVIPEPHADVVLAAVVDLSDTDTVMLGSYDPEVELNNSAIIELDSPRIIVTRIQVTDVNGEPVLPSETEDAYFNSTMLTLTGRQEAVYGTMAPPEVGTIDPIHMEWFRMNERSGTVAKDRLYRPGAGPGGADYLRATADLNGVVVGLNNGPDGRANFEFTGDSYMKMKDVVTGEVASGIEFSFRTDKSTQFLVSGYRPATGELWSLDQPWELWMVDGYLEVRQTYNRFPAGSRTPATQVFTYRGTTKVDDGQWHHIVWQKSSAVTTTRTTPHGTEASSPNLDTSFQMELIVDAKVDLRRRVGISPRGFVTYVGGRDDTNLDKIYWFKGDMTEFVARDGRVLSPDEISRQRDAMFGVDAYWTQPARLTAHANDANVRGNKTRLLVLHFGASDDVYERRVTFSWEPNALNILKTSPETLWHFGSGLAGRTSMIAFAGLGDHLGPYDFVSAKHNPDRDLIETHVNVIADKNYGPPYYGARKDERTDNYRLLDLDIDLNMEEYDVISIVGYPGTDNDWREYDVLDGQNAEPFVPARMQLEMLMGQIKEQVVTHGKGLFVADPFSAIALGIIDQVDLVPEYYEREPLEFYDRRLGAVNPGFDGHAFAVDPFQGANPMPIERYAQRFDGPESKKKAASRYTDQHGNVKQRVRAVVEGLTDVPGYVISDIIEWVNANPVNSPPYQLSIKFEAKHLGLKVGDEFYIDAPTTMRSEFYNSNSDRYYYTWKHHGVRVAAPINSIKVGTAVTSFLPYFHNGTAKAASAFTSDTQSDLVGNPFYDHAISIAIQPGDVWDGKPVQGKVYVNFTESMQMFAHMKHTVQRLPWNHLDGYGLEIHDEVAAGEIGKFPINPARAAYQYSTHFGSWGGTEIKFVGTKKPDWGWSAGGVRGSGLSGGGGEAMNWAWKPAASPLVTLEVPTMSERGLLWLMKDITTKGNAPVLVSSAEVSTKANDVTVETTSDAVVELSTARLIVEAHKDMDSPDGDITIMVQTPRATVKAISSVAGADVETARVQVRTSELGRETIRFEWAETILLTLPRQIETLILEEN